MHGLLVGAVLGMAVVAFMGVWRSINHWRNSKKRAAVWVLGLQVVLQAAIGVIALVFGFWFLVFGE